MTTIGSRRWRRQKAHDGDNASNAVDPHLPPSVRDKSSGLAGRHLEEDRTPAVAAPSDAAHLPTCHGLKVAAAEARFRLAWGLSARLSPVIHLASRLLSLPAAGRPHPPPPHAKNHPVIPRRWYVSHIFFWLGSGTACWFQFRRRDRAAARRHLIRSVWIPPLVWLVALTAIGTAIPDEAIIDMVRNAPYTRAP